MLKKNTCYCVLCILPQSTVIGLFSVHYHMDFFMFRRVLEISYFIYYYSYNIYIDIYIFFWGSMIRYFNRFYFLTKDIAVGEPWGGTDGKGVVYLYYSTPDQANPLVLKQVYYLFGIYYYDFSSWRLRDGYHRFFYKKKAIAKAKNHWRIPHYCTVHRGEH